MKVEIHLKMDSEPALGLQKLQENVAAEYGAEIEDLEVSKGRGLDASVTEFLVSFALTIPSGVASGLLANFLYESLKSARVRRARVGNQPVTFSVEEISEALELIRSKKAESE